MLPPTFPWVGARNCRGGGGGGGRPPPPPPRPEYGTVTYYTATCSQCGAEQVTVGRFRGTVIPDPSELEIRDITTSQHDED